MGQDLPSDLISLSTQEDSEKLHTDKRNMKDADDEFCSVSWSDQPVGLVWSFVQVVLTYLQSFG